MTRKKWPPAKALATAVTMERLHAPRRPVRGLPDFDFEPHYAEVADPLAVRRCASLLAKRRATANADAAAAAGNRSNTCTDS